MHSDGSGGTHWHVAITNGNNYYASGDAIIDDPCPSVTKNEGLQAQQINLMIIQISFQMEMKIKIKK